MKKKFMLLIAASLTISLNSCLSSGIDTVNAYEFKIGNTVLFNEYNKFIDEMGLPSTFVAFKDTLDIENRSQLDSAIAQNVGKTDILNLCYPNFEMEYFPDNIVVPLSFDFRNTDKEIEFNDIKFNNAFTIDQFKRVFRSSGQAPLDTSMSLFSIVTGENSLNLQHFIVARQSKNVEFGDSGPTIEFTFENGKLIYMFFANF